MAAMPPMEYHGPVVAAYVDHPHVAIWRGEVDGVVTGKCVCPLFLSLGSAHQATYLLSLAL